jgi:hypothetical protein
MQPVQRVEFVGQSLRDDDNEQANTSRLINFYREPSGGVSGHTLKSVLGLNYLSDIGDYTVRAIGEVGQKLYAVADGNLLEVTTSGAATTLGVVRDREHTFLFGAELNKVCVVSGGRYFVWDGTTLERPEETDAPFSVFGSGVYLNGYVILTEQDGRRFLWTDLADATNLEGLNFATAESTDKKILQAATVNGRLWLMKSDVIEVWTQTGSAGANAFARVTGGTIEVGLKAKGLVNRFTGGLFFVGSDNIVYLSDGQGLQPISPPPVNTAIAQGNPTHCLHYEDEGHKFCVVRFSDRPAWCYDIVTGEWHERATNEEDAWDVTAIGQFNGVYYTGSNGGAFHSMLRNNVDGQKSLIRTAISKTVYNNGTRFRVPLVELTGRVGQGADEALYELGENLVTNGTFDTDISGWADESDAGGSIAWDSSGYLALTFAGGNVRAVQDVSVVDGDWYFVSVKNTGPTNGLRLFVDRVSIANAAGSSNIVSGEVRSVEVVASGAAMEISVRNFTPGTALADNVSVRKFRLNADGTRYVRDPQVMVSFSKDGGKTFGQEWWRSFGAIGDYDHLCRIRNAGLFRRASMKVKVSEPKDITLDAQCNVVIQ